MKPIISGAGWEVRRLARPSGPRAPLRSGTLVATRFWVMPRMCFKLIHAVLLVQTLLHGVLGCCWHHAHGLARVCCHVATAAGAPRVDHGGPCCCSCPFARRRAHSAGGGDVAGKPAEASRSGSAPAANPPSTPTSKGALPRGADPRGEDPCHEETCHETRCAFFGGPSGKTFHPGADRLSFMSPAAPDVSAQLAPRNGPRRPEILVAPAACWSGRERCARYQAWLI